MDCAPNQICDRSNYVSLLQDLCLVQLNTLFLRLLKWSGWCFFSGGLGVMDLSWCYRFFRNKFFLSLLSREVEDETVSSRLCDWFGGEGAEVRPGEEVPEWWCRLLKIVKLLPSFSKIYKNIYYTVYFTEGCTDLIGLILWQSPRDIEDPLGTRGRRRFL